MPPAIPIIAALGAEALGATAGGLGAGALGLGGTALDLGALGTLSGADIGAGLGGGLASGVTTGLMTKNPIEGLIGGVTGALGGPSVAQGVGNLASDVGVNLGLPGTAATTAATGATPAAATATSPATAATTIPSTTLPGGAAGAGAGAIAPVGGAVAPLGDPTATGVLGGLGGGSPGGAGWAGGGASAAPVTAAGATAAAPAGATAASAAPSSFDQFTNDPTWHNAFGVLKSNPSAVAGALGLGYDMTQQGNVKGLGQLESAANTAGRTSQELSSYINTGNLPPGYQAAMDQAKQAAKAQLRSKYASLGMSGSTAEAQDLANVDVQAVAAQAQVAGQLLQSGIQESGVASDLLAHIVGINQQQDTETQNAIMQFAQALGGANMGGIEILRTG